MSKRCLVLLCLIFAIEYANAGNITGSAIAADNISRDISAAAKTTTSTECQALLQVSTNIENDLITSQLSPAEQSYLRLIESSLQLDLISGNDIDLNLQNLRIGIYANPLATKTPTSQNAAYRKAFDKIREKLALDLSSSQSALIESLENILAKSQGLAATKEIVREESIEIFGPHVSAKIRLEYQAESSPTYFKNAAGHEILAVGSRDGSLYLIDLKDLKNPVKLNISGAIGTSPTYMITAAGKEMLVVSTTNGSLHFIDLNDLQNPVKIKIQADIRRSPIYFTTQDGREMMAAGSVDSYLYLIDLNDPTQPRKIKTGRSILASPTHFVTQDKRDILAFGSMDEYLYLIDLSEPKPISRLQKFFQPKEKMLKLKTAGELTSSPIYFVTQDGKEMLAIRTFTTVYLFDLKSPGHPFKINAIAANSECLFHFVTQAGQEKIAIGSYGNYRGIIDLKTPGQPEYIEIGGLTNSPPTYFASKMGREMLAFGLADSNLYLHDLKDPQNSITIKVGHDMLSRPTFFSTAAGRELVTVNSRDKHLYIIDLNLAPPQRAAGK